jgi:hypothetical protein
MIVAVGRAASTDRIQQAIDWWNQIHLPDLFTVPGVLAAMRFSPLGATEPDMLLHLLVCDETVADVMGRVTHARRYHAALGRFPAYGGAYESIAFLPYESITPSAYDFDVLEESDHAHTGGRPSAMARTPSRESA